MVVAAVDAVEAVILEAVVVDVAGMVVVANEVVVVVEA